MSEATLPDVHDCRDHREAMVELVRSMGWQTGAEIGVGSGKLSRRLLRDVPWLALVGVDACFRADRARAIEELRDEYRHRYLLLPMRSTQGAKHVTPGSLDFAFIDAGHSYRSVHDDVRAWRDRVSPNGWLLGHDYGHPRYHGVRRAVREWFGDRVHVIGHTIWAVSGSVIHAPIPGR